MNSQRALNRSGTVAAKDLEPGDKVGCFVVRRPPVPAGTRGRLWWKKQRVRVEGIDTGLFVNRDEVFDADAVLTLNPHD